MTPNDQRVADQLERTERDLEALLELSQSLTRTAAIESTLYRIAELMADVLESDRCSIILLDTDHGSGFIVATSDDPSIKNLSIDLNVYPEIRETIRRNEPVIVENVHRAPLFDEVRERIRGKPVGSTILFPVAIDRRVQGVMHLRTENTLQRELTSRELRFGRIVANATGIALRNARLYESIRDRSERRLTERIRAERRLRQIEKYQRFFDFAGDGLMIIDGSGRILFANRAARTILGFEEDDMSRIRLGDIVVEESVSALDKVMDAVFEGRYERAQDLAVLRASGDHAVLSLTTAPLEETQRTGDLPGIVERGRRRSSSSGHRRNATAIVSFRDVTVTRAMEDELRRTKDFLSNLIASSPDAIVAADMDGRIIIFSDVASEITGWSSEEAIGTDVECLYPPGVARTIMSELRSREQGGRGQLTEHRQHLMTKSGAQIPVSLAAAIIYDGDTEVASVGIFSDLRERIQLEQELARAQRKLELTERQSAVMELAGAAAHELNQPLTSIFGIVELMQRKIERDPITGPYMDTLLSEAERMAESVKKLGQITRYKSKHYVGDLDILDLDAAAQEFEE